MRHHFHRCSNLRVVTVEAEDLGHRRRGGSQILEELCEARRLDRCVGLAECDVLSPEQKRDLLVARATRLRQEEGGRSALADAPDARALELAELRSDLLGEHEEIVAENRRCVAEAAAALQRNPRPLRRGDEPGLIGEGIRPFLDDELRGLRTARLDGIERALEGLVAKKDYGECVRCGRPIEVVRLRQMPDTAVCMACASAAFPDSTGPA